MINAVWVSECEEKCFGVTRLETINCDTTTQYSQQPNILSRTKKGQDILFFQLKKRGEFMVSCEFTRSGWVHSPCCNIRLPSRGSVRALDWAPLETASPRRCSGNQPEDGRIPAVGRTEEKDYIIQALLWNGQPSRCAELWSDMRSNDVSALYQWLRERKIAAFLSAFALFAWLKSLLKKKHHTLFWHETLLLDWKFLAIEEIKTKHFYHHLSNILR